MFQILFEDENFLVINKPYNISCSRSLSCKDPFVINEIVSSYTSLSSASKDYEFGLPHRLDKITSGLLLLTKNNKAYEFAIEQFKNKAIKKKYISMNYGNPKIEIEKVIKVKINMEETKTKTLVKIDGKETITLVKIKNINNSTKENNNKFYLCEFFPITGKRHQIRVVSSFLGIPILGDTFYGGKEYSKTMLFSSYLEFKNMENKNIVCDICKESELEIKEIYNKICLK